MADGGVAAGPRRPAYPHRHRRGTVIAAPTGRGVWRRIVPEERVVAQVLPGGGFDADRGVAFGIATRGPVPAAPSTVTPVMWSY